MEVKAAPARAAGSRTDKTRAKLCTFEHVVNFPPASSVFPLRLNYLQGWRAAVGAVASF